MQIHYYSFSRLSILPWRSWHYWHLVIKLSNEFVWVLDTNLSGNKSNTTLSLIGEICHNRTSVTSAAEDDLSKQYIASGFHIKRIPSGDPVPWLFIWNNVTITISGKFLRECCKTFLANERFYETRYPS